jgi:EAL and modified HD-GYP domain-containing signal transduction protein
MPPLETGTQRTATRDRRPAKPLAPSYALIIRILNLVRTEADLPALERELKQDVALSYRLLRYINSAGMGFPAQITSYRQAVTVLGYHELYRWLTLLLLTADPAPAKSDAVTSSIVRGRFLELLGRLRLQKSQADDLFIVGIFSRLDELLDQPMETLLEAISISDAMREALLVRGGTYGQLLSLVEAIEAVDSTARTALESSLGVEVPSVDEAYATARSWAASVLQ